MSLNIGILANLEKPDVEAISSRIADWADKHDHKVVSNLDGLSNLKSSGTPFGYSDIAELKARFAHVDVLITVGGDGTLLYAVPIAAERQIPVLSVNLGSLGFHTQASPDNLEECLQRFQDGHFILQNRMLFRAAKLADGKEQDSIIALNDIVVSKTAWGHMITLHLRNRDEVITDVSADALIVATPTGSSAYNYAAGGPVLAPDMECIILNALCAHRMRVSPLILPPDTELIVSIKPRRIVDSAQIVSDGQPWLVLDDGEFLKISRASMYLPLVIFENDFYGKMRDKLRWGGLF